MIALIIELLSDNGDVFDCEVFVGQTYTEIMSKYVSPGCDHAFYVELLVKLSESDTAEMINGPHRERYYVRDADLLTSDEQAAKVRTDEHLDAFATYALDLSE